MEYSNIALLAKELGRPVAIFDTETSGGAGLIAVIELAFLVVDQDGGLRKFERMIDPGKKIAYHATLVHGITDEMVEGKPIYASVSNNINHILTECAVAGYNSDYDLRAFRNSAESAGVTCAEPVAHLDIRKIWIAHSGGNKGKLGEVAEIYGVETGNAHRAMGDVLMTASLLDKMIETHGMNYVLAACHVHGYSDPALTVKRNHTASAPKKPSERKLAGEAILNYLSVNEKITAEDYSYISEISGVSIQSVSFYVSDMFSAGQISENQVVDSAQQALLEKHLPDALLAVDGAGRLKPLKEALDKICDCSIEYVQLKIALFEIHNKIENEEDVLLFSGYEESGPAFSARP